MGRLPEDARPHSLSSHVMLSLKSLNGAPHELAAVPFFRARGF